MITYDQLLRRKEGIGGSDAAAICGLSRWKTPIDIYIDKTREFIPDESKENQYMYWGNVLEPIIIKQYEKETGNQVVEAACTFRKPDHKFMIAHIDGWIPTESAVLECKTANSNTSYRWGDSGSDLFPDEYLIQCAHYAMVCNANYVDLAVLIGGNDFRKYRYERNEDLEGLIMHAEYEFWNNHVLKRIPPAPRTEEDFNKIIKSTKGNMIYAKEESKNILSLIKDTEEEISELEEKRKELLFEIKKIISDNDGLIDDRGNILCTWKFQESNRFDIAKFKKEHSDIYNNFLKKTNSRQFRIRRK
jgi:putative phage-type endonuclease